MTPEILRILGECFGAAAIAEGFCIYFSRTRQRILIFKFISDLLWCCNYLCLGNLTGALLNVVGMTRETVFYLRDKKKFFASPLWLLLFLIATAASPTYSLLSGKEGLLALLPAAGAYPPDRVRGRRGPACRGQRRGQGHQRRRPAVYLRPILPRRMHPAR